jgi:hypothetical protein
LPFLRQSHGLRAIGGTQFGEDVVGVRFDRPNRDNQRRGDLRIRQPLCEQAQHL